MIERLRAWRLAEAYRDQIIKPIGFRKQILLYIYGKYLCAFSAAAAAKHTVRAATYIESQRERSRMSSSTSRALGHSDPSVRIHHPHDTCDFPALQYLFRLILLESGLDPSDHIRAATGTLNKQQRHQSRLVRIYAVLNSPQEHQLRSFSICSEHTSPQLVK